MSKQKSCTEIKLVNTNLGF